MLPWLERDIYGVLEGLGIGLLTGTATGIMINFVTLIIQSFYDVDMAHQEYRWRKLWSAIRFGAAAGISQGTVVGILLGADFGRADGFLVALSSGIAALKFLESGRIQLFEAWGWSWARAKLGVLPGLLLSLVFGAIYYVAYGIEYSYILAPTVWMIMIVGFGLTNGEIGTTAIPNQGIYDTARGALRISLAVNIPYALANIVGYGLSGDWPGGIGNGLSAGITFGICCWLICGGLACVQHVIVRRMLCRSGVMPWNYAAFLDYAVEKTFLRRVGGGYVFLHRLLLEYFAGLNTSQLVENENSTFLLEIIKQQPTKLD